MNGVKSVYPPTTRAACTMNGVKSVYPGTLREGGARVQPERVLRRGGGGRRTGQEDEQARRGKGGAG